jgi:N-acetylglucosamine-6-phosphate deacetylase
VRLTGRVVTPTEVITDAVVRVSGGRIEAVGPSDGGPADKTAAWILPGFVDLHVHGGGGHSFTSADPDAALAAARFHAGHGTTTTLASLVAAPIDHLHAATVALRPLVEQGVLHGVHYEGPYLSSLRCGAQNPAYLRPVDLVELAGLLDLGGIRMMTIAPELPNGLAAIELLRDRGVIAAVGHTDATYEQTLAAVAAGATVGTHVCNGMRPIHHREPGPIVALLDSPSVVCEQIADGVHLHDGMLRHAIASAGPARVALITDAIDAAGMPDGQYELGGQRVRVADGVARLETPERPIAGSTLTMDAALRRAVHSGVSIVDAAAMAASTPARALSLDGELGAIIVGHRADLVLLDDELRVIDVLRAGESYPENLV